ncbi:MAG: hypothetical protein AB7S56_05780 [Halothiobacillaceae bacterium]
MLKPAYLLALALPLSAFAEEPSTTPSVIPSAYLDFVGYGDDTNGMGGEYLQNANGIFNVHQDDETGGHSHGGELRRGLNFRGFELALKAEIPGWVDGALRMVTDGSEGEIEEAWLRSRILPGGLQFKGGLFFSDIGIENKLHPHDWAFVNQSLPYQMLFAGGLSGSGLQINWSPELPFKLTLGAEAINAENEGVDAFVGPTTGYVTTTGKTISLPFAEHSAWPGVYTLYAKSGIAIREDHHLFGGISYIKGRQHQEMHRYHPGINDADHSLQGSTQTYGIDAGYHYHADRAHGAGDLRISAEYFYQSKDLTLIYHDTKPWNVEMPRELNVDAFVIQAQYGIAPRWDIGLRYDMAGNIHEAIRSASPVNCLPPYQSKPCPRQTSQFESMQRITAALTWHIDERQHLRLELARATVPVAEDINADGVNDAVRRDFNQIFLQYQLMLGGKPEVHTH